MTIRPTLLTTVIAVAVFAAGIPARADEGAAARADALLDDGARLYADEADCPAAVAQFRASYDLRPGWRALNGIALCQEQQERDDLALATYEQLLVEFAAELSVAQRDKVQARVVHLESRVGRLEIVTTPPAARVLVDGAEASPDTAGRRRLRLPPGRHHVVATADGWLPLAQDVTAPPGRTTPLALVLVPVPVREARFERRFSPWIPYATLGAGGAFALLGAGALAWAQRDFDAYDDAIGEGAGALPTPTAGPEDLRRSGERKRLGGQLLLGASAVGITGGVVLLLVNRPRLLTAGEEPRVTLRPTGVDLAWVF